MSSCFLESLYKLDGLSIIMVFLIAYIGLCVIGFASRYMKGDKKYRSFFVHLIGLIFSVSLMVIADNLWLLLGASCFSNWILVRLMIHNPTWQAAKASGVIAGKNHVLGAISMASAFGLLFFETGQSTVSSIIYQNNQSIVIEISLLLLLLAAMMQSALWPFHKWLIGSLNSPTPVSSIMHAGLINGGGFILVRFAPLYLENNKLMVAIFLVGMVSAVVGTLWKLMQSDVKRMLACSTMAQMGFTFVQCGLGLFPLAVAHLFLHGMFKAHLFLGSGSAAQEKRLDLSYPPKPLSFICALLSGVFASFVFASVTNKSWGAGDSTLVLMMIVLIAGTQLALPLLRTVNLRNLLSSCGITAAAALLYGASTQFIALTLAPMQLMQAQPLNIFHILGMVVLVLAWLCMLFVRNSSKNTNNYPLWMKKAYVKALNSSQPCADTITSHRNHYQYK
ncbi:MAG: proton-conducting membrane transporter [Alphaproteobacteria bacterium]|nr:proton-conducting membrane transporter [Alphaproteobacteria bacterium]